MASMNSTEEGGVAMHSATFVAILDNGEHVIMSCGGFKDIGAAHAWLHRQVNACLLHRKHSITRFWYMLGADEAQEYLPEEVEEVFFDTKQEG